MSGYRIAANRFQLKTNFTRTSSSGRYSSILWLERAGYQQHLLDDGVYSLAVRLDLVEVATQRIHASARAASSGLS